MNNPTNNPNILSNKLDQAPKVGSAYEERLKEPKLQKEICNAMDRYVCLVSAKGDGREIVDWVRKNQDMVDFDKIYNEECENISFFIYKQKNPESNMAKLPNHEDGFIENQSKQNQILGPTFYKRGYNLNPGENGIYLTFTKTESGELVVSAKLIRFKNKTTVTYTNLNSHQFEEILTTDSTKIQEENPQ